MKRSVQSFQSTWDNTQSLLKAVDSSVVYSNELNPFSRASIKKTEYSIKVESDTGILTTAGVPIFDSDEIKSIMDSKYNFVHLGAFIFGLQAHFPDADDVTGKLFVIDHRRSDPTKAVIAKRAIRFVNGKSAVMIKPNFSIRKSDLEQANCFSAYFVMEGVDFKASFSPFSVVGGSIYRLTYGLSGKSNNLAFGSCSPVDLGGTSDLTKGSLSGDEIEMIEGLGKKPELVSTRYLGRGSRFAEPIKLREYGSRRKRSQVMCSASERFGNGDRLFEDSEAKNKEPARASFSGTSESSFGTGKKGFKESFTEIHIRKIRSDGDQSEDEISG
uniref:Movement protein n=1 Tax=Hemp virus T TaxID=3064295 RepID=A0AA50AFA2_9VIRU|nr:MAG: movement protein [Hemp virus T]